MPRAAPRGAGREVLERVSCVALGGGDQPPLAAARRRSQLDRMPRAARERFGQHRSTRGQRSEHDPPRQLAARQVVLAQRGFEQLRHARLAGVVQDPRLLPHHPASALHQHRDRSSLVRARESQHVRVEPSDPHHLLRDAGALQERARANSTTR